MKFVFYVLLFAFSSIGWTQDKQQTSLSMSFHYGKVDVFPSLQFNGCVYKRITFESSLGVGFRTTILQGRLFLQFSTGIGFNVLSNVSEKLSLSPMISGRIGGYQLSPETRLNYTELMPGYSFTWGKRIRLVQSAFFGKGWESNHSDETFPFWTFSVNLGIGYVF
jgi:hypothetical protein